MPTKEEMIKQIEEIDFLQKKQELEQIEEDLEIEEDRGENIEGLEPAVIRAFTELFKNDIEIEGDE